MRDHDDELPDDLTDEPSRSQKRREALAVFDLAERLVALSEAQLAQIPMSEDLRAEIARTRGVTQHIAHKRQLQFLAKQMRRREDELPAMRAALDHDRAVTRRETAGLHRLEAWRDRLVEQGDDALQELLLQCPQADRQQLRQLSRQARTERLENRPPHAFRELFRVLREMFGESEAADD